MSPDLSRRDALVALGAAGVATAGLGALAWDALDDGGPSRTERETIVAVAEALYPSSVTGVERFVEDYVVGRVQGRADYLQGVRDAATAVDEYARFWEDTPYADLDRETRQAVLAEYGVTQRDPDPTGSEIERVRYYLYNELLFAFYSSPTGGSMVGIENPPGHPGGTDSYRQGPPE